MRAEEESTTNGPLAVSPAGDLDRFVRAGTAEAGLEELDDFLLSEVAGPTDRVAAVFAVADAGVGASLEERRSPR